MTTERKVASLAPSDMSSGGGLIDDVNVEVVTSKAIQTDYKGTAAAMVPALEWTVSVEQADGKYEPHLDNKGQPESIFWSFGDAAQWAASADGKYFEPIGTKSQLNVGANGGILIASVVTAGFPEDKLRDGDVSVFEGCKFHLIRVAAPKRSGLVKRTRADGREFEDTILTVDKVLSLAGETAEGGGNGADLGRWTSAGVLELAETTILTLLATNGNTLKKNQLAALTMNYLTKEADPKPSPKDRGAAVGLSVDDAFLGDEARAWTYADGSLTLG